MFRMISSLVILKKIGLTVCTKQKLTKLTNKTTGKRGGSHRRTNPNVSFRRRRRNACLFVFS